MKKIGVFGGELLENFSQLGQSMATTIHRPHSQGYSGKNGDRGEWRENRDKDESK